MLKKFFNKFDEITILLETSNDNSQKINLEKKKHEKYSKNFLLNYQKYLILHHRVSKMIFNQQ